ncbi:light-sensor protein kinase [Phtheirospermum japonicum]|uniref:Light-sensor protein kinase n=1 Tax=Phtheirospermum japonicum TaxID=374723 RepID=A0A830BYS7_9LAMI|nr:light-sensor protein kinase [Phtheirospermum japonicum]
MDQFRQIGEVVGSLNALMIFQNNMFNQKQCCLLVDMLSSGYQTIADHMKKNLKFDEKATKWKIIEHPLKELLRVFKEGESYVRQCLDVKDFWAKSILLYQNADCIEFHVHNLLTTIPIVIEAIEMAGQISGSDQDEMHKKKLVYSTKYHKDMRDPRIFQWMFGGEYLVSQDTCSRLDSVWGEDRWHLLKIIKEKKSSSDMLLKYLNNDCNNLTMDDILMPSSTLVGCKDYQVRRRLGNGSQYKEIQWLGENFALRHFFGDIDTLVPEISMELSLSHPNILHILCAFADEEKKECFLVMELMSRDLSGYIKEICGPRKRIPFSLPVAVDLMLQIARGMEYLHSKKIYHGELSPSNILIKARNVSMDGYLHVKVSGFGLSSSISSLTQKSPNSSFIWYAPEVLAEQENFENGVNSKFTEKADVYSFGMICFELLTGKVPFEDAHLQGDKMSRNIRAGERPLFPFHSPKYITNLTKKCWHTDPIQRPSFSTICRILRYTKRFLVMNPEQSQPDAPMPPVDFSDLEGGIGRSFCGAGEGCGKVHAVYAVPFQMFAYRVTERERASTRERDMSESGSDGASTCDERADDSFTSPTERKSVMPSPEVMIRKLSLSTKRTLEIRTGKQPGKIFCCCCCCCTKVKPEAELKKL